MFQREAALAACTKKNYDVIILDYSLTSGKSSEAALSPEYVGPTGVTFAERVLDKTQPETLRVGFSPSWNPCKAREAKLNSYVNTSALDLIYKLGQIYDVEK